MGREVVLLPGGRVWPHKQILPSVSIMLLHFFILTRTTEAQLICPESSRNCLTGGYDEQYVYGMTCSEFDVQDALPAACQYSLTVSELTVDPKTSTIKSLPARALDGLKVRKLVLSGLGVETVNGSAFTWLAADLQELYLDGNLLMELPEGVFSPLSSLEHLQLQNNQLTTISKRLLDGLANLLVLDLSGNRIGEVSLEAWQAVPMLSTLRLHDNVIDDIMNATRLNGLTQLRKLQLDGNRISGVTTDAFRRLPNLQSLNVARNRIPALPNNVFAANSQLEEVDASQNEVVGLTTDVFNETKRLTRLSLHDNRIDTIPIYVFRHMYNLRTLLLHSNSISGFLSNSLSGLSSLRQLDLSGNRIASLPTGVFDPLGLVETLSLADNRIVVVERRPFESMRNLVTLDLSNNQLESVNADWFQTTSRLTELRLSSNRLNTIHREAFSNVPALQEVYLDKNLLSSVDGGLFRACSSLEHLDLSSNPLRRIQDAGTAFTGLASLRRMNLTSTCLTELSFGNTASSLPALEELDLSSNTLYNLTATTFDNIPSLRRLHLAANDLEMLQTSLFSALTNLELLDLSGNALAADVQLSAVLSTLPSSVVLDLSWNLLTSVDELPVQSAGVYLLGNPLRCDCNSMSRLKTDPMLLLDAQQTACLDVDTGRPDFLACHWSACSTGTGSGCSAPQDSLTYLAVPRRHPVAVCPWDAVPPAVQSITVDVISTTSINVRWNLTDVTDVVISVISDVTNTSNEIYEVPANTTEYTVGNLTSGGTYDVCVTTTGGHRACVVVVVVLPVAGSTAVSLPSLELSISATSTESALHVTWHVQTSSGVGDIAQFRLTWTANGTWSDLSTAWMDRSNTSYTISGLRRSTVYLVCVQALGEAGRTISNETQCEYFSTQDSVVIADTENVMLIIIIAAASGAFLLLVIITIVIIICCCCRRHHDDELSKRRVTVRPAESTRSVSRGRLAEHSTVSVSIYENIP